MSKVGHDRRWIADGELRDQHDATVRSRLAPRRPLPLTAAADRLGVSAQTVRRRVKSGKLRADHDARGRITGVYLPDDETPAASGLS